MKVTFVVLLARCTDAGDYSVVLINPPLPADSDSFALEKVDKYGGLHFAKKNTDIKISPSLPPPPPEPPVKWQLKMTGPGGENLQEDSKKRGMEVEDLLLVLGYKWDE
ncbi:MAG: hypothetical protein ACREYC_06055 [Gammaproteobacteria bacterium]